MCVPGSHRSNFPPPDRLDADLVVEVPMRAGDVVIFTEALRHGTATWQGPEQRRTLLYKYSPGNSAWAHETWPAALMEGCTPRQQLMLQPPSVGHHRPVQ